MAEITNAADAKRVREYLIAHGSHELVENWRRIRDRRMDEDLMLLSQIIGPKVAKVFAPVQTEEPDDELQRIKAILVSNETELELFARGRATSKSQVQKLKDALIAVNDTLWPIEANEDECDAVLGDGGAVSVIEYVPQDALAPYADADDLERYAEADDDADEADEPDGDDDERTARKTARERYRAEYKANGGDHEQAFKTVTREAQEYAGFCWQRRSVDRLTFWGFEDKPYVFSLAMEDADAELDPLIETMEQYGYTLKDSKWQGVQKTEDGKPTGQPAIGASRKPREQKDSDVAPQSKGTVRYSRIVTRDQVVILVDHPSGGTDEDPGAFLQFPNPLMGVATGYYFTPGNTRARGNIDERHTPVILGQLVQAETANIVDSALLAMALEEASRDLFQNAPSLSVNAGLPFDAQQDQKGRIVKDGNPPPVLAGEVKRTETTGVPLQQFRENLDHATERYRSKEYTAGTGSAGESGLHLARVQTAQLTVWAPIQERRAATRRRILTDLLKVWAKGDETQLIPYAPKDKGAGGEVRASEVREITPDMARLPVDMRVTIGAESPETKAAREAAEYANVQRGVYGMSTMRRNIGVVDPDAEVTQMAIDNMVKAMVGTDQNPGWVPLFWNNMLKAWASNWFNTQYPAPSQPQQTQTVPPEPVGGEPPQPPAVMTQPPAGNARETPPVQQAENPGAGGAPGPVMVSG